MNLGGRGSLAIVLATVALVGTGVQFAVLDRTEPEEIVLKDSAGRVRAELSVRSVAGLEMPGLHLIDEDGMVRAAMFLGPTGTPMVNLLGPEEEVGAILTVTEDGDGSLILSGRSPRVTILDTKGKIWGTLLLSDEEKIELNLTDFATETCTNFTAQGAKPCGRDDGEPSRDEH